MRRGAVHWLAWLASLVVLCALAWLRVEPAGPIQTDILRLLPPDTADAALTAANARSRDAFSQQLLILVRGPDDARTQTAALAAQEKLLAAGLTESTSGASVDRGLAVYRQHGFALLQAAQIQRLRDKGAAALATDVAVSLAGPTGLVGIGNDPGGYVREFVGQLPRPYPDFMPDGDLLSASRGSERVFLSRMQLPDAAFGSVGATQAVTAIAAAQVAVAAACPACRLQATGAALFTAAASDQAHREALVLGITSTLLIMLLIAWAYRSLAPHVLGFVQLGASIVAAAAAVVAVFGSIHVLTLVFGTTLLGIAIDYAFLYYSEYWFGGGAPGAVWGKVRSGLGVGLLTGVAAFAFLALTGFPALSQMAIFSIAGLAEAALVVALIFPVSLTATARVPEHSLVRWPARFFAAARRRGPWRWWLPLLALAVAAPGAWRIRVHDDVRELSRLSPTLLEADGDVRATLGRYPAPGYYLIQGADIGQALARETELTRRLRSRLPQADLLGLSRFLPPPAQQQASLSAWANVFADDAALRQAFVELGLPAALADHVKTAWRNADRSPLRANALFDALPDLRRFLLPGDDGVAVMATLFGTENLDATALHAAAEGIAGVRFIEPLTRIDEIFTAIRVRAMWLVLLGYLAISAILIWRYRWREAVRMLYPPVLALVLTLGALGWLGIALNIFSVVALILILGLGRDYAVFLREAGASERPAALTVALSAATTIIGFGLLAFSETPALQSFGLATGLGIFFSYLVTPLSLPAVAGDAT